MGISDISKKGRLFDQFGNWEQSAVQQLKRSDWTKNFIRFNQQTWGFNQPKIDRFKENIYGFPATSGEFSQKNSGKSIEWLTCEIPMFFPCKLRVETCWNHAHEREVSRLVLSNHHRVMLNPWGIDRGKNIRTLRRHVTNISKAINKLLTSTQHDLDIVIVVLRSRHGWSGWSLSKEARLRLAMEGVENEGLRQNYH